MTAISNQDHYTFLGVSVTASEEEIRKAYKTKSLEVHPDKVKNRNDEAALKAASESFKLLGEAYDTLRNPTKRAEYGGVYTISAVIFVLMDIITSFFIVNTKILA